MLFKVLPSGFFCGEQPCVKWKLGQSQQPPCPPCRGKGRHTAWWQELLSETLSRAPRGTPGTTVDPMCLQDKGLL